MTQHDILISGKSGKSGIRFVFADATAASRDLASNHLAGPAAARALAEGLSAAAVLAADLGTPLEAATIQIHTQGPISSLLVESTFEGTLRGYTGKKILPDFDEEESPDMDAVFGPMGSCNIMVSLPGKILSQSSLAVANPRPANVLREFYASAAQRPVAMATAVRAELSAVTCARGILFERMPDSDPVEFDRLAGAVAAAGFQDALAGAASAAELLEKLSFEECGEPSTRPIRFACRCSREKALASLMALPEDERRELAARTTPVDIYCHMCGKCHTFQPAELQSL